MTILPSFLDYRGTESADYYSTQFYSAEAKTEADVCCNVM